MPRASWSCRPKSAVATTIVAKDPANANTPKRSGPQTRAAAIRRASCAPRTATSESAFTRRFDAKLAGASATSGGGASAIRRSIGERGRRAEPAACGCAGAPPTPSLVTLERIFPVDTTGLEVAIGRRPRARRLRVGVVLDGFVGRRTEGRIELANGGVGVYAGHLIDQIAALDVADLVLIRPGPIDLPLLQDRRFEVASDPLLRRVPAAR